MNKKYIRLNQLNHVTDLATGNDQMYSGNTQREKVIAAYAQSLGNWNSWTYGQYSNLVIWGNYTVTCGNFTAFRNSKDTDDNREIVNLIVIGEKV
jgi:hypothetical protein